jgi:hypothetical protein
MKIFTFKQSIWLLIISGIIVTIIWTTKPVIKPKKMLLSKNIHAYAIEEKKEQYDWRKDVTFVIGSLNSIVLLVVAAKKIF